MNQIIIDVIITTFNGAKFIDYSLNSVLNQSYEGLNVVIVDDGSTDNTLEIIKTYDDQRIVLYSQSNKGYSAALNSAIELVRGDYFFILDHDDFIPRCYFEEMVNKISNRDYDCIISGKKQLYTYKNYLDHFYTGFENLGSIEFDDKVEILSPLFKKDGYSFHLTDKLFKTSLIKDFRFNTSNSVPDLDSCYKLLDRCHIVCYLPDLKFYPVSIGSSSLSKQNQTVEYWQMINNVVLEMQEFLKKHSELRTAVDEYCLKIFFTNSIKLFLHLPSYQTNHCLDQLDKRKYNYVSWYTRTLRYILLKLNNETTIVKNKMFKSLITITFTIFVISKRSIRKLDNSIKTIF